MVNWKETSKPFLYTHDVRDKQVFCYCKEGRPVGVAELFNKKKFLLLFIQTQIEPAAYKALLAVIKMLEDNRDMDRAILFVNELSENTRNWWAVSLALAQNGSMLVEQGVNYHLGQYTFSIQSHCHAAVVCSNQRESLVFMDGEDDYALEFTVGSGGFYRQKTFSLEVEGEEAGEYRFALEGVTTFSHLNAGIFYSLQREKPNKGKKYIDHIQSRALELKNPINMESSIDFLAPFDEERSCFWLPEGRYATHFPVYLSANLELSTKEKAARLVFAKKKVAPDRTSFQPYLTFSGACRIESDSGSLLTGYNGMEYVNYEKGAQLYFVPKNRSYFTLQETGSNDVQTADTAYLAFDNCVYFSQSCALYEWEGNRQFFDYMEVPFQTLSPNIVFPVFPLAVNSLLRQVRDEDDAEGEVMDGYKYEVIDKVTDTDIDTSVDMEPLKKLDMERLSQRRNLLIPKANGVMPNRDTGGDVTAITENGLVATVHPGDADFCTLEFGEKYRWGKVGGKLRQALLSSRAFLLVTDAADFKKYASIIKETAPLNMGGWEFDFSSDRWEKNDGLVLVKYTTHKSILELAEAEHEWSYPTARSSLATQAGERLKQLLEQLHGAYKEQPSFDILRSVAADPNWRGVIVFHAPVDGGSLPDNLQFLFKRAAKNTLIAHHLIFSDRAPDKSGVIRPGRVDGLLYYEDLSHPLLREQLDFDYKLEHLVVVFRHTKVQDFSCTLSVALNYFLKSPLKALYRSNGNYMLVDGSMVENKETSGVYEYIFKLRERMKYSADYSALNHIFVDEMTLSSSAKEERVTFFLSGKLLFRCYDTDLFSYGYEKDDVNEEDGASYLSYVQLKLSDKDKKMSVVTEQMNFLSGNSIPREKSLARQFPTQLKKILISNSGQKISDLGYNGIHVENIKQEEIKENWVGLVWEIDLGGLGALAAAGNLVFSLMTAWCPPEVEKKSDGTVSAQAPGLAAALRIGLFQGVNGLIPIQGIMSLKLESVELKATKNGALYLFLRDFSLEILKKSLPGGSNNIYVFGNAKNPYKLGWYCAYEGEGVKNES